MTSATGGIVFRAVAKESILIAAAVLFQLQLTSDPDANRLRELVQYAACD